ncbi:MAG: hypothetical protein N2645_20510 [Clostridia bacterium]|nr:hypothetical protein [Clostridia bacterium]
MMQKTKKILASALLLLILLTTVQVVVAETLGVNLLALLQQKASFLVGTNTQPTESQLEQAKKQTLDDTSNYLTNYLNDLQNSLHQFSVQESESAKNKLKAKGEEIKNILESQKQMVLDDSKAKIKIKIDEELNEKLNELDNELNIIIEQKFK